MSFASKLMIPLLFGIIIPCTLSALSCKTAVIHVLCSTNTWKTLDDVQLCEEDSFSGSITGISYVKLLKQVGSTGFQDVNSVLTYVQKRINQLKFQIQVVRDGENTATENLIVTLEDSNVYRFHFNYKLPTIQLELVDSDLNWNGVYNKEARQIKLTSTTADGISELESLLPYYLETQTLWNCTITNIDGKIVKQKFSEVFPLGSSTEKFGLHSLIVDASPPIVFRTFNSQFPIDGNLFKSLGKIKLRLASEQLVNIKNSIWGTYWYATEAQHQQTVYLKGFVDMERDDVDHISPMMGDYVNAVMMYNSSNDTFYGLVTVADKQINFMDTEENLRKLKSKLVEPNCSWYLNVGMGILKTIEPVVPEISPTPIPRKGVLHSLCVDYKIKSN